MAITKIVDTPFQAYSMMQSRLILDLEPVWKLIDSNAYSPFWLLARELFPVAESIGDLIYKSNDPTLNLAKLIDNDMSKIGVEYKHKGKMIAHLFRHSLMHQDEPRSIYSGNISIYWSLAFIDGRNHLLTIEKDFRNRSCVMQFDLRTFYEDLLVLLEEYKYNGPRQGVVARYNSWTFRSYKDADVKKLVRDFYNQT